MAQTDSFGSEPTGVAARDRDTPVPVDMSGAVARASERDFRLIIDSIPGLVSIMSATGELEFVNRQLLQYFDRSLEECCRGSQPATCLRTTGRVLELARHLLVGL